MGWATAGCVDSVTTTQGRLCPFPARIPPGTPHLSLPSPPRGNRSTWRSCLSFWAFTCCPWVTGRTRFLGGS